MRSIDAISTSNSAAILIAVILWWKEEARPYDRLEETAELAGAHAFQTLHDWNVGAALYERMDLWNEFERAVKANPAVYSIYLRGAVGPRAFREEIQSDLGMELKATKWWEKNLPEIKRSKRKIKQVKQVMES